MLGDDNIVMACCHVQDEAGLPHLHLDIIPIDNGKLSSKTLITRDLSYEETETRRTGGLSAKEYKNTEKREG